MTEMTFETFSRKLIAAADGIEKHEAPIALAGAKTLAGHVAGSYRLAAGGDGRLSGTGRKRNLGKGSSRGGSGISAPVSATAKDVRKYGSNYVALVIPTGPYGLLERDIKPHLITPFSFTRGQRNRRVAKAVRNARREDRSVVAAARLARFQVDVAQQKALRIPGSKTGFAAAANHPGTRGKAIFSRSVRTGGESVVEKMGAETTKQMLAGYKGAA